MGNEQLKESIKALVRMEKAIRQIGGKGKPKKRSVITPKERLLFEAESEVEQPDQLT